MIVRVPRSTWGTLPETGASSILAPAERTRSATWTLARGLTLLMSTYTLRGHNPATTPSGPSVIS
jgi:hypothetical protein